MISNLRHQFNQAFSEESYQKLLNTVGQKFNYQPTFRIAESPVFLPNELLSKVKSASNEIIEFISDPQFNQLTNAAIPTACMTAGDEGHPYFFSIDFALVHENGNLEPKLIEVQGFPSLFAYQPFLAQAYKSSFGLDEQLTSFIDVDEQEYYDLLKECLLGDCSPEEVVLLEIKPKSQHTYIDFLFTEHLFGIKPVCISEVWEEGDCLYYKNDQGKSIRIKRIYNRVIFDELALHKDIKLKFSFEKVYKVKWVAHPNYFFRISKYLLPFLNFDFVPRSYFLDELEQYPNDLENYVFKPLYSFSGSGIKFDVTKEDLNLVDDPQNYILQRKVDYAEVVDSPNGAVKCELRVMVLWPEGKSPVQAINLARLSRGKMIGVKYNKDFDWVGGSTGLFYKE